MVTFCGLPCQKHLSLVMSSFTSVVKKGIEGSVKCLEAVLLSVLVQELLVALKPLIRYPH